MKQNDDLKKKKIDTLVESLNETEMQSPPLAKRILTQKMVSTENTVYHIHHDFDLDGKTIKIPDSSTLQFDGGSISNGVIEGNYSISNQYVTPDDFGYGASPHDSVFQMMVSAAESSRCAILIPKVNNQKRVVYLSRPIITTQKVLEDHSEYTNCRLVYSEDEFLPRVTPNVSTYGIFRFKKVENYIANQSIAYHPDNKQLCFGIEHAAIPKNDAYVYVTDMNLKQAKVGTAILEPTLLTGAAHINDMMFSYDFSELIVAPLYDSIGQSLKKPIIRTYLYSKILNNDIKALSPQREIDLSTKTNLFANNTIDSLCHASEEKMYIIKGGNVIVFFDYLFNVLKSITIDQSDRHGDPIISQSLEYYKGHILQISAGDYTKLESPMNAYLNIYRLDGTKIDTYRYANSLVDMEAEGICNIGNGKFLFTYYAEAKIEVRLLNFNTSSHTHTYSDIIDIHKLGVESKSLLVNPNLNLADASYLYPDGSEERPFPNIADAIAYMRVFQSRATICLMDGDYGAIELNNIYVDLTFKAKNVDKCKIKKVFINKCRDLLFENIIFTDTSSPFEAYSATIEISKCSFPGSQFLPSPSSIGKYGINLGRNCAVTLRECKINNFNSAVRICGGTLFLEGTWAISGEKNYCGIRGEKSVILGSKDLSQNFYTEKLLSTEYCILDSSFPNL